MFVFGFFLNVTGTVLSLMGETLCRCHQASVPGMFIKDQRVLLNLLFQSKINHLADEAE